MAITPESDQRERRLGYTQPTLGASMKRGAEIVIHRFPPYKEKPCEEHLFGLATDHDAAQNIESSLSDGRTL
jgi:hypothetical protein